MVALLLLSALCLSQAAQARRYDIVAQIDEAVNAPQQPSADTVTKAVTSIHDSIYGGERMVLNELRRWKEDTALARFITGLGYPIQDRSTKSFDSALVRYLKSDEYDSAFVSEYGTRITALSVFFFQLTEPFRSRLAQDSTIAEPDSANILERRVLTMIAWPALERVCDKNGIQFPPPLPPLLYSKMSKVLPLDPNTPENDLKQGLKKIQ